MNYEKFRAKKNRIIIFMFFIGVLIFFIELALSIDSAWLFIFLLIYVIICYWEYTKFICSYPNEQKIDKMIQDAVGWWEHLDWKERLKIYKKNKI